MKVLVVNTVSTRFNGITNIILNYTGYTMDKLTFEFVLNGYVNNNLKNKIQNEYGKVYIPVVSRIRNPFAYMYWMRNIIITNRFDAIYIHGNSGTLFFDTHAARLAGISKIIVHCHSSSCRYKLIHYLLKPLLNRELSDAVACSDLAGKWLFTRPFSIITNGIEVQRFVFNSKIREDVRMELNITNDAFVIGHVANFEPVKNHLFLLKIFKKVLDKKPNALLLLLGDGTLRESIEKSINTLGIENRVKILGNLPNPERQYQVMDVFVLPSLFEGLPVTLIEAQASGLKCVVSDVVTKQADITKDITFLPIGEFAIDLWVNTLSTIIINDNRFRNTELITSSDFNIKNCVKKFLDIFGVD